MKRVLPSLIGACLFGLLAPQGFAQNQSDDFPAEDSFSLENAILDTSILFAIGAREARQELRGAFGWPTFQEGLVDGVYFRFDPDGYARFAPSPRLDTDVFEVICRPRTLVCMGRKNALSVSLNSRGQIELKIENIAEGDVFSVAEGISELQLPPRILSPLEPRLEILLSSNGELVIRRNQNEVGRISLKGFGAVITYLRWVAAQQDYASLPRDWPVPNAPNRESLNLTQTSSWNSPMRQPEPPNLSTSSIGVAEVKGELKILREILLAHQGGQITGDTAQPGNPNIGQLQQSLETLSEKIESLQDQKQAKIVADQNSDISNMTTVALPVEEKTASSETPTQSLAQRLDYLITEIGLEPEVALILVQQRNETSKEAPILPATDVVNNILTDLQSQIPELTQTTEASPSTISVTPLPDAEYVLLTQYFRSVFEEAN